MVKRDVRLEEQTEKIVGTADREVMGISEVSALEKSKRKGYMFHNIYLHIMAKGAKTVLQ